MTLRDRLRAAIYTEERRLWLDPDDLEIIVEDLAEMFEKDMRKREEFAIRREADGGMIVPLAITSEERIRAHARRWEPEEVTVVNREVLELVGPWEPAP